MTMDNKTNYLIHLLNFSFQQVSLMKEKEIKFYINNEE